MNGEDGKRGKETRSKTLTRVRKAREEDRIEEGKKRIERKEGDQK